MLQAIPVILCGGSGTRLWPLSRTGFPKQFLCLTGNESLFQQAAKRLADLGNDQIQMAAQLIVSGEDHRYLASEQLREVGIALGAAIEGVVLTASLTGQQHGGSVSDLPLDQLRVPVLVHQHAKDSCKLTPPYLAERLMGKLTAARVKKYMLVDGGKNPTGDPCQALHYHGYIGMEAEAVAQIASWIQRPMP